MAYWTWQPDFELQNQLAIQDDLPSNAGAYGDRDVDSLVPPTERCSFTAEGLTFAEVVAIRNAARARPPAYTAVTHSGSFVGKIESFKAQEIRGTEYWQANLTLFVEETPFE